MVTPITKPPMPPGATNPLPTTDTKSLYTKGNDQDVVADFKVTSHYERDFHRYMMGTTSTTISTNGSSPPAFVQLAGTTLLWIADWTGSRFLSQAMIPDPKSVNPGWVLLDAWLEPYMIVLAPNGTTPLYRVSGVYIFGHKKPGPGNNIFSNIYYPLAPWVADNEGEGDGFLLRAIQANALQNYLLEPGFAVNGPVASS